MLRYIMKREVKAKNGLVSSELFTFTDPEDVESTLRANCENDDTYDYTSLVGVEVVD